MTSPPHPTPDDLPPAILSGVRDDTDAAGLLFAVTQWLGRINRERDLAVSVADLLTKPHAEHFVSGAFTRRMETNE